MNLPTQPSILLVPGAFTNPSCYDLLLPYLERAGLPVVFASLPSSNPEHPDEHTAASDGAFLLDRYLMPLINDGQDVVVFAHSFGATSLSGADKTLSKRQRSENGLSGGVVGLIYMSFAMCTEGQSQVGYVGGTWPPFCKLNYVRIVIYKR
jgi:pimeloyl-ACP methyl ester carboxylesterase